VYLERQLGLADLIPRRAAVTTAIAFWALGLALAMASVWNVDRVHPAQEPLGWSTTAWTSTPTDTPPASQPLATDEQPGIVEMPADIIVAHTPRRLGVTELQKP